MGEHPPDRAVVKELSEIMYVKPFALKMYSKHASFSSTGEKSEVYRTLFFG